MTPDPDTTSTEPDAPPRKSWGHWLLVIALALLLAGTAVSGIVWWQERPLLEAEHLLQEGDAPGALVVIDQFLERHPDHERAAAIKARALVALGRWQEAVELFERHGAAEPADLHALASALLHLQRWREALTPLQRLLELDPQDADALHEITATFFHLGMYDAALETAQHLAALPGYEAQGNLLIGTIQRDMGNKQSAAEAWAKVLEHNPEAEGLQVSSHEFLAAYGEVLLDEGRPADALPLLQRSLAIKSTAAAQSQLAEAYTQLGDERNALKSWADTLALDPAHHQARESLANAALRASDNESALKLLKPLADSEQLRSSTAYLLQRTYTALEQPDEAEKWQQRAAELRKKERVRSAIDQALVEAPQAFWSRVVRAHRFAERGNWQQAEQMIETLAKEAPDEPFVQDLQRAIQTRGPLPPLDRLPVNQF